MKWAYEQAPAEVPVMLDAVLRSPSGGDLAEQIIMEGAVSRTKKAILRQAEPTREITSLRPWLARKAPNAQGGMFYESRAVKQREWSDGSTDYVCPLEDCGFDADNPASVYRHYGNHVRKGEAPPASPAANETAVPGTDYTEPVTERGYTPTDRLLSTLTEQIKAWGDLSPAELAAAFLTWAHERPDLDREEREPRELTAEEIVVRIRSLVWQPIAVDLANAKDEAEQLKAAGQVSFVD